MDARTNRPCVHFFAWLYFVIPALNLIIHSANFVIRLPGFVIRPSPPLKIFPPKRVFFGMKGNTESNLQEEGCGWIPSSSGFRI